MNINKITSLILIVSFTALTYFSWVYVFPLCLAAFVLAGLFYHETFKGDLDRISEFKVEQDKVLEEMTRKIKTLENVTTKALVEKMVKPS